MFLFRLKIKLWAKEYHDSLGKKIAKRIVVLFCMHCSKYQLKTTGSRTVIPLLKRDTNQSNDASGRATQNN